MFKVYLVLLIMMQGEQPQVSYVPVSGLPECIQKGPEFVSQPYEVLSKFKAMVFACELHPTPPGDKS